MPTRTWRSSVGPARSPIRSRKASRSCWSRRRCRWLRRRARHPEPPAHAVRRQLAALARDVAEQLAAERAVLARIAGREGGALARTEPCLPEPGLVRRARQAAQVLR